MASLITSGTSISLAKVLAIKVFPDPVGPNSIIFVLSIWTGLTVRPDVVKVDSVSS